MPTMFTWFAKYLQDKPEWWEKSILRLSMCSKSEPLIVYQPLIVRDVVI